MASERFTGAQVEGGFGIARRGSLSYEAAVEELGRYAQSQLDQARRTLDAIARGEVRVDRFRGIHAMRDVRELSPDPTEERGRLVARIRAAGAAGGMRPPQVQTLQGSTLGELREVAERYERFRDVIDGRRTGANDG